MKINIFDSTLRDGAQAEGISFLVNDKIKITKVLDEIKNGDVNNLILDASAACHMPDVIEMPYMPPIYGASKELDKDFKYRLTGPTCLAGDVVGDYSFDEKINNNDLLIFGDMAIYSMCKNNTFNGMTLPSIYKLNENHSIDLIKSFDYSDFKERLGQ